MRVALKMGEAAGDPEQRIGVVDGCLGCLA